MTIISLGRPINATEWIGMLQNFRMHVATGSLDTKLIQLTPSIPISQ
jgi:hypothetical protein